MDNNVASRPAKTDMLPEAIQCHQAGDLQRAGFLYRQILNADPDNSDALHLYGVIEYQKGKNQLAVEYITRAIAINPSASFYHNNLGNAYQHMNMDDKAIQCFREAIRLKPDNVEACNNLGNALRNQGSYKEASDHYMKAIDMRPDYVDSINNLANVLKEEGRIDEAILEYRKVIKLKPDLAEAYYNLGNALEELGELDESVERYRKAISLNPDLVDAYNNLGNVLKKQKKFDEAFINYKKAVTLKPDFAEAYNNLGDVCRLQGRFDESIEQCQKAILLKPDNHKFYLNLGNAFLDRGNANKANEQYLKAIEKKPDSADAHYNRGLILLMNGKFEEGWKEYEWRFRSKEISKNIGYRYSDIPEWDGSLLHGKTVLVITEQGLGDHIQFLRYMPMVKKAGGRVVFACRSELMRLFDGFDGVDNLWEEALFDISDVKPDVCVQLLNLPLIFGTTLDNIIADVPYLKADPLLVNKWKSCFNHDLLNVGLVWSGSPFHKNNHNRSCSLSDFAPLVYVPGIALYSLQKGSFNENDADRLESMQITDLGKKFSDLYDTAAVIENMDVVITVDTSVAHLAGALAKPVWTLLPFVPDWRWMLDRNDSPWYPTMRLFRQPQYKDWAGVMKEVASELEKKACMKGASNE